MFQRSVSPSRVGVPIRMIRGNWETMKDRYMRLPDLGYQLKFNKLNKILQGDLPLCWLMAPLGVLLGFNPQFIKSYLIEDKSLERRGFVVFSCKFGFEFVQFDNSENNSTKSILVNLLKKLGLNEPGLPSTLALILDYPILAFKPEEQTNSNDMLVTALTFAQVVTFCSSRQTKKLIPEHVYAVVGYTDDKWILLETNGKGSSTLPDGAILNTTCTLMNGSFVTLDKRGDDSELALITIMYNLPLMKEFGMMDPVSSSKSYVIVNSFKPLMRSELPPSEFSIHKRSLTSGKPHLSMHFYLFLVPNTYNIPSNSGYTYIFTRVEENLKYVMCRNYGIYFPKDDQEIEEDRSTAIKFKMMKSILNNNENGLSYYIKATEANAPMQFAAISNPGFHIKVKSDCGYNYLSSRDAILMSNFGRALTYVISNLDLDVQADLYSDLCFIQPEMLDFYQAQSITNILYYYDTVLSTMQTRRLRLTEAKSILEQPDNSKLLIDTTEKQNLETSLREAFMEEDVYASNYLQDFKKFLFDSWFYTSNFIGKSLTKFFYKKEDGVMELISSQGKELQDKVKKIHLAYDEADIKARGQIFKRDE